jgi:hypothetical protein
MLQTEEFNCLDSLSYVDVGAGVSLLFEPRHRLDDHVYCPQSGFSSVRSSASTVASTLSRTDALSAEMRFGNSNSICLLGEQSVEANPYNQTCHQGFGVHKRFRSTDDLHPYLFSDEMQHKRHRANTTSANTIGISSIPDRAHFSALCIWTTSRVTASSSAVAMSCFPSTVSPLAATFGHESFAPVQICRSYAPRPAA